MPGIVRLTDKCSGHGCWVPRPSAAGSPDVFDQNIPVERFGDPMEIHCCPSIPECHGGIHIGTHTVFVNNLDIQVKGDPIDCGSVCDECSSVSFADGT
jgi:uncharacterized Zn-binding protein involved in type VI secretion